MSGGTRSKAFVPSPSLQGTRMTSGSPLVCRKRKSTSSAVTNGKSARSTSKAVAPWRTQNSVPTSTAPLIPRGYASSTVQAPSRRANSKREGSEETATILSTVDACRRLVSTSASIACDTACRADSERRDDRRVFPPTRALTGTRAKFTAAHTGEIRLAEQGGIWFR
jgi:hypothetical protein